MAVGIKSSKRWLSGCMQGGSRLVDSERSSIALSLTRGLFHSDRLGPSVLSIHAMDLNRNTTYRQRNGTSIEIPKMHKETKKERREGKSGRGGLRRNMTKAERLSRKHYMICSRNSPRETFLWLWSPLRTENKNAPRKATWTEWRHGNPEAWRARNGDCNSQGSI